MSKRKTITFQISDDRMKKLEEVIKMKTMTTDDFETKPTLSAIINYVLDLGFASIFYSDVYSENHGRNIKKIEAEKKQLKKVTIKDEIVLIEKDGTTTTIPGNQIKEEEEFNIQEIIKKEKQALKGKQISDNPNDW